MGSSPVYSGARFTPSGSLFPRPSAFGRPFFVASDSDGLCRASQERTDPFFGGGDRTDLWKELAGTWKIVAYKENGDFMTRRF